MSLNMSEEGLTNFQPKPGGQFYQVDESNSFTTAFPIRSTENFSGNAFLHPTNSKLLANRTQQRSLSAKTERNPTVFAVSPNSSSEDVLNQPFIANVSSENMHNRRHSVDPVSNVGPPSDQSCDTSYINLTWWTTKFSNQGLPLTPTNMDALTVPVIPHQQHPLPTSAGPIHFTTRMHKVAPYHNAFSRLSPLQQKPFNKSPSSPVTQNEANSMIPVPSGEMQKSFSSLSKENRFKRTAEALQKSGLWDIAMKTGHLIKRNQELQKELEQFKMDALNFLKSVIKNPENRDFIKSVLNSALCVGATEGKKSAMTVVVSAAAAVAAVSASDSAACGDVCHSSGAVEEKLMTLTNDVNNEVHCGTSKSKDEIFSNNSTRTSVD